MRRFECKKVEIIKALEQVDQLFIDGMGQLDVFEASLKGTTFLCEFPTIIRYIEHFSNGNSAGGRLKYLTNSDDNVTEYEFITKHLRIYAIQQPGRKIIICGGIKKKADSSDNIEKFRLVKKDFLNSIKTQKNDKGRNPKR